MTSPRAAAPRVWLIAGPTASGKSALALSLARTLGGDIVNADSMQIYADLRILTARPDAEEEAQAPHHLFGVADAADAWSVGRWLTAARGVLGEIASRGRVAVVVGGTGLYFRALTRGLADIPAIGPQVRAEVESRFESLGEAAFRRELSWVDGAAEARIAPNDRQRLVRALEVHAGTGKPLTAWQDAKGPALEPGTWRALVIDPPRQELFERCDRRLTTMVEKGVLGEVNRLIGRRLAATLPAMKALGVAPFADHLAGQITLAEALVRAQTQTRHYAKRQITWLRTQAPDWERLDWGASRKVS